MHHTLRSSSPIRVLLIDDHVVIGEAMECALRTQDHLTYVGQALSLQEGLTMLPELKPDVVVLDLALPDGFGINGVPRLREHNPDLGIVIFSMCEEQVYAEHALKVGAQAYLMKTEPMRHVREAIEAAYRGEIYLSRRMTTRLFRADLQRPAGFVASELTAQELHIFRLLGRGYSVEKIAEDLSISRKTVEAHRRQAKEKLGFDLVAEVVQFAVQWEYAHEAPAELGEAPAEVG